jgi:hypothetical protein
MAKGEGTPPPMALGATEAEDKFQKDIAMLEEEEESSFAKNAAGKSQKQALTPQMHAHGMVHVRKMT